MRTRLLLTGLAMLILLGLAGPGEADDFGRACTPAGTWTMKVDFDFILPPPATGTEKFYLQFLQFFTVDGRTTNVLPTGPGHPNVGDTRIGCMGEWRPWKGGRPCEFDVIQHCLYNQAWDGVYGEVIGTMKVARDGRKLTFKFSYIDHNGDGTVNYDQGTGVAYGTRLQFPGAR